MPKSYSITESFGANLAELLAEKISAHDKDFNSRRFVRAVAGRVVRKTYTERVLIQAEELRNFLPEEYPEALKVLLKILGPENPHEAGMFTHYYWLLPVGKFIELYGLEHFKISLAAIAEITKRNTGEYAIRPYIRHDRQRALTQIRKWAQSENFHLRRLASEGLRPRLPWAAKLDTFVADPTPVFAILELLKEDPVKFVKKSVANHLTDYLKVNPAAARPLIARWNSSRNEHTRWIVKHATRKYR